MTSIQQLLQRTPDEIQADADLESQAKEKLQGLVSASAAELYARNAAETERLIDESDYSDTDANIFQTFKRFAECLFLQGKFREAVQTAVSDEERQEYENFTFAFDRLGEICEHETMQIADGITAKGTTIPAKREIQRIFVLEKGAEISFIYCENCKQLFAKNA